MSRRIRIVVSQSRYIANKVDGIRLRVEAIDASDMPTKIFAYLMQPTNPATRERAGAFDHICSPVDLEEYPEDEPVAHSQPAWFRLDYLDVLLRSTAEVDQYIAEILSDIRALKRTLDTMDTLEEVSDLWIDDAPESSSSATSESSEGG